MTKRTELSCGIGLILVSTLLVAGPGRPRPSAAAASRQLLIVLDGLRPDYVTPDVMPALHALGQRGVVFERHHAVFPTVTRVNASSMATGTYPGTHGLMGNTVYFPRVDPRRFLNTEDRGNLLKIEATGDRLLTATTLGELLERVGKRLLVVSAGSTGASYLLNGRVSGGAVIQTEYTLPASLHPRVVAALGEIGADPLSSAAKNRRAVDAFLKIGLPDIDPAVTVVWFTDPDTVAHESGIGDPATVAALKQLDGEVKRLLDGLAQMGALDTFDVWVTSDHGFSTHTGAPDVAAVLQPYAGTMPDASPRIVSSGGAIYVRDHDAAAVEGIVRGLQRTPGVGAIFTPASSSRPLLGRVAGTLSFESVHWAHERSADILFSPDWTDRANSHGFKGTTMSGGTAGHGSSSPFDIHNTLIAVGPDVKRRSRTATPSGNVDFAPTFLHLLGISIPASMEGRVLLEAVRASTAPAPRTRLDTQAASTPDGTYTVEARFSVVQANGRSYRYLDGTNVRRRP